MKNSKENIELTAGAWFGRGTLFFLGAVLVSAILILGQKERVDESKFVIGEPAPWVLFSPFELVYDDEIASEVLRQKKRQSVPVVYKIDPEIIQAGLNKTKTFFQTLESYKLAPPQEDGSLGSSPLAQNLPFMISEPSLRYLLAQPSLQEAKENLQILIQKTLARGALPDDQIAAFRSQETGNVILMSADKSQKVVPAGEIFSISETFQRAEAMLPEKVAKNRELKKALLEIFSFITVPNLAKDEAETEVQRRKAAQSVSPVSDTIKKDELIAQRGRLVTPREKQRIDAIQSQQVRTKIFNQLAAMALLVLTAYMIAFVYIFQFDQKMFRSWRQLLLIQATLLLTVVISKFTPLIPGSSIYLMPASLASLLLVLLLGPRMGIMAAIVATLLISPIVNFQVDLLMLTFIGSLTATFTAGRLRKRIEFIRVGFAIGLAQALAILAINFFQDFSGAEVFQKAVLGVANGILITLPLCFLIVPLFETIFGSTTDITLLELSDLNHPLLKRMVVEAPGTYHHSLVVSTLAESACEAIGANALLARVGCYFHDIGKIAQSEYFTENVGAQSTQHDDLSPTMSFLTILNHVKGGLELGRQHKLREPILRFIPEHHGTGVVWYFYKKALDQAKPGQLIQSDSFRYPGPKPQSRETAVALLADSTEAASRSVGEPTPEKLRQLVRKVINDKFIDGQLDECDLTLKDLHQIQESFVHNLLAIFHTRIKYPPKPEAPDKPDLFETEQFSKFRFDPKKKK